MSSLRRGFVALEPPAAALEHVARALAGLRAERPSLRWSPRLQWHLSLQFLGRVDDPDALVEALRGAAASVEPFTVRLGGGGAFAKPRTGTVLWIGVEEGGAAMAALAGAVARATAPLGFPAEDRPFRPHLTVARATRPTDLRTAVEALDRAGPGPVWSAGDVVLFDSDTRTTGAVHTAIARIDLRR